MRPYLAAAAGLAALGVSAEPWAPLMVPALACALAAARRARTLLGAGACAFVPAVSALAVIAGGVVHVWPLAPLLAPGVAAPFALAGLAHEGLRRRGTGRGRASLGFAAGWLLVEAAWVHLGGLPLARVGYALAATPLGPTAALAGAGTVSAAGWLAALLIADAGRALTRRTPHDRRRAAGWAACLVALWGATWLAVPPAAFATREEAATTRVALIQTGVRRADRTWASAWPEARRALGDRLEAQLRQAAREGARLVVGPEGTLPTGGAGRHLRTPPFGTAPFAVLVGGSVRDALGLRNAVVDLADGGAVRYLKRHPVPGYEDRFVAGGSASPVSFGGRRLALAVCFDLLFAGEIRRALGEADVLLAVSDAAFAGRSAMPHLQLAVARLRAAEAGRPVLFVTATGPSAVLDGRGRALARTGGRDPTVMVHDLAWASAATPYAHLGEGADLALIPFLAGLLRRRGVRPLPLRRHRSRA